MNIIDNGTSFSCQNNFVELKFKISNCKDNYLACFAYDENLQLQKISGSTSFKNCQNDSLSDNFSGVTVLIVSTILITVMFFFICYLG